MGPVLRGWRTHDLDSLVHHANNQNVWRNLRDRFPHPYTRVHGEEWLSRQSQARQPLMNFAIDWEGEVIGGIGFERFADINRLTAEIGYWVAEPFWGRGVATTALGQATDHAFRHFDFERLQATVFAWNAASIRVLEKCGYVLEGRLRRAVIKDGIITDMLMYARLRKADLR
jgi:[ribosomal protein S5]-alanine N-acetyltransferase